jgi:hypothetical protein
MRPALACVANGPDWLVTRRAPDYAAGEKQSFAGRPFLPVLASRSVSWLIAGGIDLAVMSPAFP